MILSRNKPAANKDGVNSISKEKDKKAMPSLEDFIKAGDYTGAITLLEFYKNTGKNTLENDLWTAYCAFHLGDYKTAMEEYDKLSKKPKSDVNIQTYLGCCYFMLGMYKEADDIAKKAPKSPLQNRLLFHLSYKLNDEERLMKFHSSLNNVVEDQLSLASIHYLRNHYQEAIDVYKKILRDNESYVALNVYIALCSYKLDYYDVSQEYLALYLNQYPESAIALNLKACNQFRMYNGKLAEAELKALQDMASPSFTYAKDLVKHNLTVFRNGQGALQILPPLVDVIPEARLNLVIHYLKQDEIMDANELMKDVEPVTPQDYILKGIVNAIIGQEQQSKDHLKTAHQLFDLVGSSASECDTIPGRQCMAMKFFLMRQFEEVMIYLNSIKSYFFNEDTFNFMYGQAKAALGKYKEAEEAFLLIQGEKLKKDYVYLSWLARCFIMNKKPRMAWDLYLKMSSSTESFNLLQVIANDCYKMGLFFYAAKAFDVLERLDANPEFWEGKRGACVGAFQMIIGGHEPKESLRDVVQMLQNTDNPQVEYIIRTMKKYAKDNKVPFF